MKVNFKIEGVDSTRQLLKLYERYVGKGIADGVKDMAISSALSLAMRVQPYGLSDKVGKKFEESIERQIDFTSYAVRTGQANGATTIQDGHQKLRKNGGLKPRKIKQLPIVNPISQGEIEQYKRKQIAKAGRAKAGWLDCAVKLGSKITKAGRWVERHVSGKWGQVSGVGTNKISMTNMTPYLTGPQKPRDVRKGLMIGQKNGLKFIAKQIRAAIKKAERSVKSAQKAQARTIAKTQKIANKAWAARFKLPPRTR